MNVKKIRIFARSAEKKYEKFFNFFCVLLASSLPLFYGFQCCWLHPRGRRDVEGNFFSFLSSSMLECFLLFLLLILFYCLSLQVKINSTPTYLFLFIPSTSFSFFHRVCILFIHNSLLLSFFLFSFFKSTFYFKCLIVMIMRNHLKCDLCFSLTPCYNPLSLSSSTECLSGIKDLSHS